MKPDVSSQVEQCLADVCYLYLIEGVVISEICHVLSQDDCYIFSFFCMCFVSFLCIFLCLNTVSHLIFEDEVL